MLQHGFEALFGPHRIGAGFEFGGGFHVGKALGDQFDDVFVQHVDFRADIAHVRTILRRKFVLNNHSGFPLF
ncbi:hypothetical protein D3C79_974280 [compost metagenome]